MWLPQLDNMALDTPVVYKYNWTAENNHSELKMMLKALILVALATVVYGQACK